MCMHQVMAELGVIRDIDPASIQNHFLCARPLIGVEFPRVQGLQGLHHWVVILVTLSDPLHEDGLFSFQCDSSIALNSNTSGVTRVQSTLSSAPLGSSTRLDQPSA